MDGSPSSLIMFGLGNGTFDGSPSLMVTRGLGIGEANVVTTAGWLEYSVTGRCQYAVEGRAHYTVPQEDRR